MNDGPQLADWILEQTTDALVYSDPEGTIARWNAAAQSLFGFAAAEAVHGSGYLAAFAAGLTIAALDVELCDCFLEYGQTTAEMTLVHKPVLSPSAVCTNARVFTNSPDILYCCSRSSQGRQRRLDPRWRSRRLPLPDQAARYKRSRPPPRRR